jgi:cyanate permease
VPPKPRKRNPWLKDGKAIIAKISTGNEVGQSIDQALAVLGSFVAPWASDRLGSRKLFLWPTFVLFALALLSAIYAPLSLGWAIVVAVGLAAGAQIPIIFAFIPDFVPAEAVGRASGMAMSIGYIGGLVGPWLGGYILDITGTLNLNLVILAGLSLVGTYLALRLPETGTRARLHN